MSGRRRLFLLVAAGLAVLLAGGHLWQRHAAKPALDRVGTLRLAVSPTLSPATFWIAQDHGLFARAGVDARLIACATGKACAEAMLRGEADLAAATEFLATRAAYSNKDLRILGGTAMVHTIKLLARADKGITHPGALRGKRVGVKLGTNGEYFLARLLTLNGLEHDDITWVDLKPQAMADALADDRVDAVLVWPPFTNRIARRFGERLREFDGQPGQDYYYLALARQEWLAAHPRIAERAMLALKWADDWMAAHPRETRAYLAGKFGIAATELDAELRDIHFTLDLPQALLASLEAESAWLRETGHPGAPLANSLDLIHFDSLASVAPEAVTMIRGSPPP